MDYIRLLPAHAQEVARLHILGISTGFISSLGDKFVTSLYEAIAESDNSFGIVAVENNSIAGFVTCTDNIKDLYKKIILNKGIHFLFILAGKMMSFKRIRKIFETLFYPDRVSKDLPKAELLSIVVSPDSYGKGIGSTLIYKLFEECRNLNIDSLRVLVADQNKPANLMYQKCGFELEKQIDNHGYLSNIYTVEIQPPTESHQHQP